MVGRHIVEKTEQIRQTIEIVDVISSYVTLKRAGRYMKGLCPFHSEKTPSFHVSQERQTFKCFGCGAGGDAFKFIQLRENVDFSEARAILAAKMGIDLEEKPQNQGDRLGLSKTDLERLNRWALAWFKRQLGLPGGKFAREYVQSRGISDESVERFGLGFAPDGWSALLDAATQKNISSDWLLAAGLIKRRENGGGFYDAFRNRLMFPIHDVMDRVLGFGGRTLGDDSAKYINSPQTALFDKGRCLYGLTTARHAFRDSRRAIVVEGYVDCIMAQQHGFIEAVATLGTALTAEHVQLLRRYVDEVILLFDADKAGQRAGDQALHLFLDSPIDIRLAQVPEGKDPAELLAQRGPEALKTALTLATPALESKWKQVLLRCGSDARGPDMRRAVEEFLSLIAQSAGFGASDPIQRGLLVNQVGKLLGISGEEVNRQLINMARRASSAPAAASSSMDVRDAATPGAASAAMKELLEVLLNEPGYYESVRTEFDPSLLADAGLRAVATALVELAELNPEFTPSELISRFESVEIARRIVDMQMDGERRGNYPARVEGAIATLQRSRDRERVSQLRAAGEAARGMNHFAARRHLTAPPVIAGAAPSAPQAAE